MNLDFSIEKAYAKVNIPFDPSLKDHPWRNDFMGGNNVEDYLGMTLFRDKFVSEYSFSIPTTESIDAICKFAGNSNIVEHMAGSGYWASHISEKCKISCFDAKTDKYKVSSVEPFYPVAKQNVKSAKICTDDVLLLSWIPYGDNSPISLLKQMASSQKLILIGEMGGCCAGDEFWEHVNDNFDIVEYCHIPKFKGINDTIAFLKKR